MTVEVGKLLDSARLLLLARIGWGWRMVSGGLTDGGGGQLEFDGGDSVEVELLVYVVTCVNIRLRKCVRSWWTSVLGR